nr:DUF4179 domain-containing protein [Clostridium ganghwense]
MKFISSAACFFLAIFIISIRVSPAFASFVKNIPGISYIIELINYDKGLKSAVRNNFIQPINVSDEHDGLIFTVDNLIVDESRMIIFYSIENKTTHKFVNIANVKLQDKSGNDLDGYCSSRHDFIDKDMTLSENKKLHNIIDITFENENNIPEELNLQLKMMETNKTSEKHLAEGGTEKNRYKLLPYKWNTSFSIDKNKFKNLKEEYNIDKTICINNQNITFKKSTIYPTRISVDISFDPNNTSKILVFNDLKLVDEKGNEWTEASGMSGKTIDTNHITRYFESNFFEKPESLYITCSSIQALDKSNLDIVVNLEKYKLIKAPDDKLALNKIVKNKEYIELHFNLKKPSSFDKNKMFSVFNSDFKDSDNNYYHLSNIAMRGNIRDLNNQNIIIKIPKKQYKNPLTFTVHDYPTIIYDDFKVKIK